MTAHAPPDPRYAAFRNPAFVKYWVARFLGTLATQVISVAVGWQVYDLTGNPLHLGLIGLVQFLPAFLLVLITGAASDRFGRRMIMSIALIVEAVAALGLISLTITGLESPLPVFVILLVFGIARAFFGPAAGALVANIVPEKDFANAVSWNASAWQTASIAGPVIGGLIYGLGAVVAYGLAFVLFGVAVGLVILIPKPDQRIDREPLNLKSILAGFDYIRREKVVLGAISLDLFAVLLGGVVALMPVFARDILEIGPWGLGLLRSAPGVGAIAMAFALATWPVRSHAGVLMLFCVGLFGFFTVVFGLSQWVWLSILALALLGSADMISVYIRETLIQLWTPDHLRGRVNAVNMVFIGASNELGEFRAGTMAAFIGVVPSVVFGGIGAIGIAGLWAYLFPQLRRIQHLQGRTGSDSDVFD